MRSSRSYCCSDEARRRAVLADRPASPCHLHEFVALGRSGSFGNRSADAAEVRGSRRDGEARGQDRRVDRVRVSFSRDRHCLRLSCAELGRVGVDTSATIAGRLGGALRASRVPGRQLEVTRHLGDAGPVDALAPERHRPLSSALSQMTLIVRGTPPDNSWMRVNASRLNMRPAAPPAVVNTAGNIRPPCPRDRKAPGERAA